MTDTFALTLLIGIVAAYLGIWAVVWIWWYRSNRNDRIAGYALLAHYQSLQQENNDDG